MNKKSKMRVVASVQLNRNVESYIEDKQPFAIEHMGLIAGCYFPTYAEVSAKGRGLCFGNEGIFYNIYPDLAEDDLVAVLEGLRYVEENEAVSL